MANKKQIGAEVNGILFKDYQYHPRVLELRFILWHRRLSKEFGPEIATQYFMNCARMFKCQESLIGHVLNQWPHIRREEKTNPELFRQDVLFAGFAHGHKIRYIWEETLGISRTTQYRGNFEPANFITPEYVEGLGTRVKIAGNKAYSAELVRFIDSFNRLLGVLGRVSLSKIKL